MAFILFNHEHNNTRGFYTATYNTMNQHIFFCTNDECGNVAPEEGALCVHCEAKLTPPVTHCEDCGAWSQVFPDNCCHTCHMKRVRSAPFYEAAAQTGCVDCGEEYSVGLALDPTRCPRCVLSAQHPCAGLSAGGRRNSVTSPIPEPPAVIRTTAPELFTSPCGVVGCTTRALYYSMPPDVDEGHLILRCEEHYEPLPESPRSMCDECDRSESGEYAEDCTYPTPVRSLEDSRAAIKHIKEKLKTRMTSAQTEHWERLLKFREKELAAAEAEMWAGYDADDLRKLDLQNRRGF